MTTAQVSGRPFGIPRPGSYLISPRQSTVTIATRHLFGLGAVRATLALREGHVIVTDPPAASTVRALLSAASFQSGNGARDAAVLSPRLLDAEASPVLSFNATRLQQSAGAWELHGDLTVRGVTRPVLARVTACEPDAAGAAFHASAQATIDRYDFGITAYRGLAARRLTVGLDIVAHRER